jgi:hypothetical protein
MSSRPWRKVIYEPGAWNNWDVTVVGFKVSNQRQRSANRSLSSLHRWHNVFLDQLEERLVPVHLCRRHDDQL